MLSHFFHEEIVHTAAKDAHYSSYLLAIITMLILPTQSVLSDVIFYCLILRRYSPLARSPQIKTPVHLQQDTNEKWATQRLTPISNFARKVEPNREYVHT